MRKPWKGLLALLGIILLAGAAFTVHTKLSAGQSEKKASEEESKAVEEAIENAEPMDASTFPVVYTTISNRQVDVLHGYASERDLSTSELPVIPVENGNLSLNLSLYGNTLQSVSYEIWQAGGSEAIASGDMEGWDNSSETVTCSAAVPAVVPQGEECNLKVQVELSSGKTVWYYARILRGQELHASEMLSYVITFHDSTFDPNKAKTYSAALETDNSADSDTLAEVNINSTSSQLAWGDLAPVEAEGTRTITILELDDTYGSFRFDYEVTAGENSDRYLVSEYFCIGYTDSENYLMNYSRKMTELFRGDSSRFSDGNIDLGIASEDDVITACSDDENFVAFSVGGELWCSGKLTGDLIKVFTFRDEDDLLRSGYTEYGVKPLRVEDDGSVSFLVYGYMNRGIHEGETGISCMHYDHSSGTTEELFFLPYIGSTESLENGVGTLAAMTDSGDVYLMAGDSVYDVNTAEKTVSILADNISERNLVVNADQTAIAWTPDTGNTSGNDAASDSETTSLTVSDLKSVQILYLDTGDTRTVQANENEWIEAEGFIGDDCILGRGHIGDKTEVSGETVNLLYAILIQDRQGTEEAHYEYDGIYISSVDVMTDQMELNRVQSVSEGTYKVIDSDTLIQNSGQTDEAGVGLTTKSDDLRMQILILTGSAAGTDAAAEQTASSGISWDLSEAFTMEAAGDTDTGMRYYAYAEGELKSETCTAGEAIALVYEKMGTVIDSEGRIVWRRASQAEVVDPVLSVSMTGTLADSRKNCLIMLSRSVGGSTDAASLAEGTSSVDALNQLAPGRALNLTGAPVKALLYYINLGYCIMVTDSSNHSQLITAYDLWNVTWYDPVTGESTLMGKNDTQDFLDDGCTIIGVLP